MISAIIEKYEGVLSNHQYAVLAYVSHYLWELLGVCPTVVLEKECRGNSSQSKVPHKGFTTNICVIAYFSNIFYYFVRMLCMVNHVHCTFASLEFSLYFFLQDCSRGTEKCRHREVPKDNDSHILAQATTPILVYREWITIGGWVIHLCTSL